MLHKQGLPNDTAVVKQVLDGDVECFALLISRHKDALLAAVQGHVPPVYVEEVAHETFVKAYVKLSTYRGKKPFRNWLMGIAMHQCVDFWRQAQRRKVIPVSCLPPNQQNIIDEMGDENSQHTHAQWEAAEHARETVTWALSFLSAADRILIGLIYKEELSYREIAEVMGWNLTVVKVRAHRARKKLRRLLEERRDGEKSNDPKK